MPRKSPISQRPLGWRQHRNEQHEIAVRLFRKNVEAFPQEYIPHESLADALWFLGERQSAVAIFERWLELHPDHDMARRRLLNLRSER